MTRTKFDFTGKRAFVSGSASGIGAAVARLLADSGATVVVHGRDADRAEAMCREIVERGGKALVALGGLDDDEAIAAAGRHIEEAIGGIDILVSNAGDYQPYSTDWLDVPASEWVASYDRNLGGAVRLIQTFVPAMRRQQWGRIVLIGSTSYYTPITDFPAYGPAKAALVNAMVNLTKVLSGTGITVNVVSPGSVLTETMQSNLLLMAQGEGWTDTDPEIIERRLIAEKWPNAAGRMGRPIDIAAAVAFLASDDASYITGANLRVNGGENPSFH